MLTISRIDLRVCISETSQFNFVSKEVSVEKTLPKSNVLGDAPIGLLDRGIQNSFRHTLYPGQVFEVTFAKQNFTNVAVKFLTTVRQYRFPP